MAILTVYTKLLNKTLDGARMIDMGSTKTCQCFVLPYEDVVKVGKEYLTGKYAFYILLGHQPHGGHMAYIGQTNDFVNRVGDHKQKKDWWDTALVFVSKANEIFASEVQYLEYLGWKKAMEANRYQMDNTKPIKEPGLSDDKKNDMELFFEEIVFLTRFYGCHVFDKPNNAIEESGCFEIFTVEVKKREIKGLIKYFPQTKQYVLMENSVISAIDTSCSKAAKKIRANIINNPAYCKREGNLIRIIQDVKIPSESGRPSLPAEIVTGTSMQGTTALVNKGGKTFVDLFPNTEK